MPFPYSSVARYTLFANNCEIGAKRRKNNIRRIVYKRRLPCFVNRFFTLRCTQDLHRGNGLVDEHKVFFRRKKIVCRWKLTANNEQCTATRSSRFRQQYFIRRNNNFIHYSSCLRIVYSGFVSCRGTHHTQTSHILSCCPARTHVASLALCEKCPAFSCWVSVIVQWQLSLRIGCTYCTVLSGIALSYPSWLP